MLGWTSHGTVLLVMIALDQDRVATGVDADMAAGVESQKYATWTNGISPVDILGIGGAVQDDSRPQSRRRLRIWRRWQGEERADGCTEAERNSRLLTDKDGEERADGCTEAERISRLLADKDGGDRADGCIKKKRRRDEMFSMMTELVLRDWTHFETLDASGCLWYVLDTPGYADDVVQVMSGLCAMRKVLGYVWRSRVAEFRSAWIGADRW